ncbi:MAG: 3-oxoacyl-[acyl-carrier-protein] reductase [SAR324 cluster bacterium]|nr:3-oxoacyl-[acyl-carrier-protein] reductase [SAR324 cluster bacterium]
MTLENQVAFVTGAGRGIGKGVAIELAKSGADIVFTNRNKQFSDQTQAEIEALGRKCLPFQVDVADTDAVETMVGTALKQFKKIDILVNNAGITRDNIFLRMKREEWDQVIDVNLNGMFNVTKALIKGMVRQRYGRIVNITSVVGFTGNPGQVNYSASKSGIIGFTKSLAQELGSRNITCNAVAPGFIETDMTGELNEEQTSAILNQIPLGKMGSVDDIAQAVCFLVSNQANYITGTTLHVNGGMYG